jgi:hypothetical protein
VTVTAYICHPAVTAWGLDWLARGCGRVVVHKPLYDRRAFEVRVTDSREHAYAATLVDERGTLCASGTIELPDELPPRPARRGDALATGERAAPTREAMEVLRGRGMGAIRAVWGDAADLASYLRDAGCLPELLRPAGVGYANTSFVLGLTNYVLAAARASSTPATDGPAIGPPPSAKLLRRTAAEPQARGAVVDTQCHNGRPRHGHTRCRWIRGIVPEDRTSLQSAIGGDAALDPFVHIAQQVEDPRVSRVG